MFLKLINKISVKQCALVFLTAAILTGVQQLALNHINNYLIFFKPLFKLIEGKNIYLEYAEYYYDTYKYSPAFALLFFPVSLLPDVAGVLIWNLLNAAVFVYAVNKFYNGSDKAKLLLLIVLVEAITSFQNLQSNALLTGLIILTYTNLRGNKTFWAALMVSLAAFIKIYGAAALALGIFFRYKSRFGIFSFLFFSVFIFCPLLVLSWENFLMTYNGWLHIVSASATKSQLSVMGILQSWFHWQGSYMTVQLCGLIILLLPLAQYSKWNSDSFTRFFLASMLMFVVLFNQMSESPTYIIALTGVGIWFINLNEKTKPDILLLVLVIIVSSLSSTDLFPKFIRESYIKPYTLKAVPVLLVWLRLQFQMWFATVKNEKQTSG